MVCIVAVDIDLDSRAECLGKTLKEMRTHFSREVSDVIRWKLTLKCHGWTPRQINCDAGLRFIHRHYKAKPANARLITERDL